MGLGSSPVVLPSQLGRVVMQRPVKPSPMASVVRSHQLALDNAPAYSALRTASRRAASSLHVLVAQTDSAAPPEGAGRRFESCRGHRGPVTERLGTSLQSCVTSVRFRPGPPMI